MRSSSRSKSSSIESNSPLAIFFTELRTEMSTNDSFSNSIRSTISVSQSENKKRSRRQQQQQHQHEQGQGQGQQERSGSSSSCCTDDSATVVSSNTTSSSLSSSSGEASSSCNYLKASSSSYPQHHHQQQSSDDTVDVSESSLEEVVDEPLFTWQWSHLEIVNDNAKMPTKRLLSQQASGRRWNPMDSSTHVNKISMNSLNNGSFSNNKNHLMTKKNGGSCYWRNYHCSNCS